MSSFYGHPPFVGFMGGFRRGLCRLIEHSSSRALLRITLFPQERGAISMHVIPRNNLGSHSHDGTPIHAAYAITKPQGEPPQICVTAFCASSVHAHNRQGDWIVGQRQEILLEKRGIPFRVRPLRTARWRGFLSSRRCGGDDEAQDSKSSRPREKAGMDRSHFPAKNSETGRNRTGKKPKPLKPGLY
jgi:hypothetical protein